MPKDFQKDVGRISQKDLLEKYGCKGDAMGTHDGTWARTRGKSLIPGYFHMGWQVLRAFDEKLSCFFVCSLALPFPEILFTGPPGERMLVSVYGDLFDVSASQPAASVAEFQVTRGSPQPESERNL